MLVNRHICREKDKLTISISDPKWQGDCDFSFGTCRWTQDLSSANGTWIVGTSVSIPSHNHNESKLRMLNFSQSDWPQIHNIVCIDYAFMEEGSMSAILCSDVIYRTACLAFDNYIDSQNSTGLVVSTERADSETVSEVHHTSSSRWKRSEITVGTNLASKQHGYRVIIHPNLPWMIITYYKF